jgi:hypothetical protein
MNTVNSYEYLDYSDSEDIDLDYSYFLGDKGNI